MLSVNQEQQNQSNILIPEQLFLDNDFEMETHQNRSNRSNRIFIQDDNFQEFVIDLVRM